MNFPVKFSVRAGETYDATIAQLNARWGTKFVDDFEQKVTKTIGLIGYTADIDHPIPAECDQ
jgi:hypothetical protein